MNSIAANALARAQAKLIDIPVLEPEPVVVAPVVPPVVFGRMKNSREADKFVVRLPDGMRAEINARGGVDDRSMNAVMLQALRQYLDNQNHQQIMLESLALLQKQLQDALAAAKR